MYLTKLEKSSLKTPIGLMTKSKTCCIGQKTYWKILNNLMNKCKVARIPPLLVANKFVICCKEKVSLFNDYFVSQCQPFLNTSKLPGPNLLTHAKFETLEITDIDIASILLNLKVNKAHGPMIFLST